MDVINFTNLPEDLWNIIFSFLNLDKLPYIKFTNKMFCNLYKYHIPKQISTSILDNIVSNTDMISFLNLHKKVEDNSENTQTDFKFLAMNYNIMRVLAGFNAARLLN